MAYTSDLIDQEWEIIESVLPKRKKAKLPDWTKREILNGVLYQLENGCAWAD
ncbi:transposase [Pseudanabaena biceps]|nr:transposase [Pseudanabaena biceps]